MVYTISDMYTSFATYLVKLLEEKDWSMRRLARESGISQSTVSKIVNDAQPPTYEFCVAIAKGLGLPLDEVLALAGLLPKPPGWTPDLQELIYLFEQLTDEDKAELLELGRYKVGRREKLKAKT